MYVSKLGRFTFFNYLVSLLDGLIASEHMMENVLHVKILKGNITTQASVVFRN